MSCVNVEPYIFIIFTVSIVLANFAAAKMQANVLSTHTAIPKWKLLLGDVALPQNILSKKGNYWRKVSVASFVVVILSGVSFAYFNKQEWVCRAFM